MKNQKTETASLNKNSWQTFENFLWILLALGFQMFSTKTTAEGATHLFVENIFFGWGIAVLLQIALLLSGHRIQSIVSRNHHPRRPNLVAPTIIFLVAVLASVGFSAIGFYDYYGKSLENSAVSLKEATDQAQPKIFELENYQELLTREVNLRLVAVNKQIPGKQSQAAAVRNERRRVLRAGELAVLRQSKQNLEEATGKLGQISAAQTLNQAALTENASAAAISAAVFDVRGRIAAAAEKAALDAEINKFIAVNPVPTFNPQVSPPSDLKAAFWRDLTNRRESAVSALVFGGAIDLLSMLCIFAALRFGLWRVAAFAVADSIGAVKNAAGDIRRAFAAPPAAFTRLRCTVTGVDEPNIEFTFNFEKADDLVMPADLEVLRQTIVEQLSDELNERIAIKFKTHAGVELDDALPLFEQLDDRPLVAELEFWSEIIEGGN